MMSTWPTLLVALRAAPDLQACVAALTQAMDSTLHPLLEPLGAIQLLRVIAHRRSEVGYEGLALTELGTRRARTLEFGATTSAWQLVRSGSGPWLLDVMDRRASPLGGGTVSSPLSVPEALSLSSGKVLSARQATQVLALPILDLGGTPRGVVSLELRSAQLLPAQPELWTDCMRSAQALVDLAAPYLLGKPLPRAAGSEPDPELPVIGDLMRERLKVLESLARFGGTLLLRGAPGSGKTSLARWIHKKSARRGRFETVSLPNLPAELLEAELFGYKKGAHSQADQDKSGILAVAQGGTVFLDEVGDLPPSHQARLLRLLDNRLYRPLGADREQEAEVRFVLATNLDLEAAVQEGRFRRDLYDRIVGASVELPGLAERRDEVVPWALWMLAQRAQALNLPALGLSQEARRALEAHHWPGNLRQLYQVMEVAAATTWGQEGTEVGLPQITAALGGRGDRVLAGPLVEQIAALGVTLAEEAIARHQAGGTPLRLKDGEVLRHYALRAAYTRLNKAKDALLAFGETELVRSRNEHKEIARAREEIQAFEGRLRGDP